MKPWKKQAIARELKYLDGCLQCAQAFANTGQGGQETVDRLTKEIAALKAKLGPFQSLEKDSNYCNFGDGALCISTGLSFNPWKRIQIIAISQGCKCGEPWTPFNPWKRIQIIAMMRTSQGCKCGEPWLSIPGKGFKLLQL